MTSSPHGLYIQGYTRATMGCTKGCHTVRWSQSQKAALSSDWSLQLDSMKPESLVIVDQHATVNTFPGLVHTARHTTKVGCTRSCWANPAPICYCFPSRILHDDVHGAYVGLQRNAVRDRCGEAGT
jgi:hypothetical protein